MLPHRKERLLLAKHPRAFAEFGLFVFFELDPLDFVYDEIKSQD